MIVKSRTDVDHNHDLRKTFDILRAFSIKLNPKKCVFGVRLGKFLGFMISIRGIEANPDKMQAILDLKPQRNIREVQRLTDCVVALGRFMSRSADKCQPFFRILRQGELRLGPTGRRGFPSAEDVPGSAAQDSQPLGERNTGPLPGRFRACGQHSSCGGEG